MASPVSVGDILDAIRLAKEIWDVWYDKVRRADNQYLEFGHDVRYFEGTLSSLHKVLARATSPNVASYPTVGRLKELDVQRKEVVGNFNETLKQCKDLLKQNTKLLQDNPSFLKNLRWHFLGTQDKVEGLRARLQCHAIKINHILEPLEIELLCDIAENVKAIEERISRLPNQIWRAVSQGSTKLPEISLRLDKYYLAALEIDKPASFKSLNDFPLAEGLDALLLHFRSSTQQSQGSRLGVFRPETEQFNNLFKSRWIFGKLLSSSQLRKAGPKSLWVPNLEHLQKQIEIEYERYWASLPDAEEDVLKLGEESARIWTPQETTEPLRLLTDSDTEKGEIKILQVPLVEADGFNKNELVVIRRSNNELRLVRSGTMEGFTSAQEGRPVFGQQIVHMHSFSFVPHYALSSARSPSREVELLQHGVSSGEIYKFKTDEDVLEFQRAMLGYQVVFNRRTTFHVHSGLGNKVPPGKGRAQIWQAKPLTGQLLIPSPIREPSSPETSSTNTSLRSTQFSIAPSLRVTKVEHSQQSRERRVDEILEQERTALPLLVIFTEIDGEKGLIQLPKSDMQICKSSCDCGSKDEFRQKTCLSAVIECCPPERKRFKFKRSVAMKGGDGLLLPASWNLALLDLNEHPGFKNMKEIKKVDYINLDFSSPGKRVEFQNAWAIASSLRNRNDRQFEENRAKIGHIAAHPTGGKEALLNGAQRGSRASIISGGSRASGRTNSTITYTSIDTEIPSSAISIRGFDSFK